MATPRASFAFFLCEAVHSDCFVFRKGRMSFLPTVPGSNLVCPLIWSPRKVGEREDTRKVGEGTWGAGGARPLGGQWAGLVGFDVLGMAWPFWSRQNLNLVPGSRGILSKMIVHYALKMCKAPESIIPTVITFGFLGGTENKETS